MNIPDWLHTKRKIFSWNLTSNAYYGHLNVLRKYCDKKIPVGIPGLLQHGWTIGPAIYSSTRKDLPFNFFVWNERNCILAQERGYNNVHVIGAPFLYLNLDQQYDLSRCEDGNNLLLFPVHTTKKEGLLDPVFYFRRYVQEIEKIKAEFDNIHACLYFREYDNPQIRKVFQNANISVTTLGHGNRNSNFLANFVETTNGFEYVSSSILSTSVFYSLYLGKKVFIYGEMPNPSETTWNVSTIGSLNDCFNLLDSYPVLSRENFDDKAHVEIGEYELGFKYKKTKHELADLFGW